MNIAKGDQVRPVNCQTCEVGIVRTVADGQVLVDYPKRSTWTDPETLERA